MSEGSKNDGNWVGKEFARWILNCLLRNSTGRKILSESLDIETSICKYSRPTHYWFGLLGLMLLGLGAFAFFTTGSGGSSPFWSILGVLVALLAACGVSFYLYTKPGHFQLLAQWFAAGGTLVFVIGLLVVNHVMNLHIATGSLFLIASISAVLMALILRSGLLLSESGILLTMWLLAGGSHLWYIVILVLLFLSITLWLKSWGTLLVIIFGFSAWVVETSVASFAAAPFFLPFTLALLAAVLGGLSHLFDENSEYVAFKLYLGRAALYFSVPAFSCWPFMLLAKQWPAPGWKRPTGFLKPENPS